MHSTKHALWAEKYRPETLNDYIFHDNTHKNAFQNMVANNTIPHLLLSGIQGSGKTTIAQILVKALDVDSTDILVINASDETGVDTMREKIKNFISTIAMSGIKIVQLEEADHLSQPAQAVLRKYMEDYNADARFILTCNYEHRIIPALKSRTQQFRFHASNTDDITEFAAKILIKEKVSFDIPLLDKYISVGYPDIRKIINLLQQNSIDGVLQPVTTTAESGDYKFDLLDMITTDNWLGARQLIIQNVLPEEWDEVYKFLYENLDKSPKFSNPATWQAGILVIAEFLYKNGIIADQEINACALFIRLSQI